MWSTKSKTYHSLWQEGNPRKQDNFLCLVQIESEKENYKKNALYLTLSKVLEPFLVFVGQ